MDGQTNMGKSSEEKIEYAEELINQGVPYRAIQIRLKEKFDSGMSNSTLQKLQARHDHIVDLEDRIDMLEKELALFKRLYFELLDATKKNLKK